VTVGDGLSCGFRPDCCRIALQDQATFHRLYAARMMRMLADRAALGRTSLDRPFRKGSGRNTTGLLLAYFFLSWAGCRCLVYKNSGSMAQCGGNRD